MALVLLLLLVKPTEPNIFVVHEGFHTLMDELLRFLMHDMVKGRRRVRPGHVRLAPHVGTSGWHVRLATHVGTSGWHVRLAAQGRWGESARQPQQEMLVPRVARVGKGSGGGTMVTVGRGEVGVEEDFVGAEAVGAEVLRQILHLVFLRGSHADFPFALTGGWHLSGRRQVLVPPTASFAAVARPLEVRRGVDPTFGHARR